MLRVLLGLWDIFLGRQLKSTISHMDYCVTEKKKGRWHRFNGVNVYFHLLHPLFHREYRHLTVIVNVTAILISTTVVTIKRQQKKTLKNSRCHLF